MKLGGKCILEQFSSGNWRAYRGQEVISEDDLRKMVGPNSVDVTLHRSLLIPKGRTNAFSKVPVDPYDPTSIEWILQEIGPDGFVLPPDGFVLGAVRERFVCSSAVSIVSGWADRDLSSVIIGPSESTKSQVSSAAYFAPMYEGRSTCGRLGIESHLAAGFGDYGFGGAFTLELKNNLGWPLIIRAGMRIGQVAFEEVYQPLTYKGAYSDERHYEGPVPPKLGRDRF